MAISEVDTKEDYDEFEPDFEVTQLPVGQLKNQGVDEVEKIPNVKEPKQYIQIKEKREGARSFLALILLVGFISLLFIGMILGALIEGDKLDNIREILLTVSGILSGPIGFVVGYYFRRAEE